MLKFYYPLLRVFQTVYMNHQLSGSSFFENSFFRSTFQLENMPTGNNETRIGRLYLPDGSGNWKKDFLLNRKQILWKLFNNSLISISINLKSTVFWGLPRVLKKKKVFKFADPKLVISNKQKRVKWIFN